VFGPTKRIRKPKIEIRIEIDFNRLKKRLKPFDLPGVALVIKRQNLMPVVSRLTKEYTVFLITTTNSKMSYLNILV
jgi:hypothetical protein